MNEQINESVLTVEIFKTDVSTPMLAKRIISDLNQKYPGYRINFDLEDRDKVLRIENSTNIDIDGILRHFQSKRLQIKLIDY